MSNERRSGILLHPTSLPGNRGIGTLGAEALLFADFLAAAGQTLWQVLPLAPPGCGNSPYSAFSAFAGNPLLIDLDILADEGDLDPLELPAFASSERIDFTAVEKVKLPLLRKAAERFFSLPENERLHDFWRFCDSTFWLHDYALFGALKAHFDGKPWNKWPEKLRKRDLAECGCFSALLGSEIGFQKYMQWQFSRQWQRVKSYANGRGILLIGDAPIFVAHDSADVWCNQHIFNLDDNGIPINVAGVPPDYFSRTGQRWGNPLYRWDVLAADGYGWWIARLKNDFAIYDILRIDHFRGFESHWEIPAREKTAINGSWVKGPGYELFEALKGAMGELPLIAEDLGVITPEVEQLRDRCGFPGMRILQFAFDSGADNAYLPHNHSYNSIVYTGTHDNDTTKGWFDSLDNGQRQHICEYLNSAEEGVVDSLVRAAIASVARFAIIPMQDILKLPASGRMNIPGVADNNWGWRLLPGYGDEADHSRLKELSILYNRFSQQ
ncbi:MAG: 4-alpha-glucanotransferase [Geobacteraceae bacterium]|nr:4-alpha-glucanotransferase [Geobacteraceae bacterium]